MDGAFIKLFSLQRSFQFLMLCQDGGDRLAKIDGREGAEEVCPGLGEGAGKRSAYPFPTALMAPNALFFSHFLLAGSTLGLLTLGSMVSS